MDTINSIARTAANAVWGENTTDGKEPISGQQGDTSKGEPFDKGNAEEPHSAVNTTGHSTSGEPTGTSTTNTTGSSTTGATAATTDLPTRERDTTAESTTGSADHSKAAEFAKNTGTAAESHNVPDNERTDLKSKDTPADTTTGQNDTRDPENPQTNPKNNPTDVDDTADGPSEGQKLDGPGPKPLTEVAKEHGGDAGATGAKSSSGAGDSSDKNAEADDPNDPRAPSKGEGTGEKYVKSTGLAADGGDFDATKPGAGREADRLLEEKGIHVEKGLPKGDAAEKTTSAGSDEKEKKSLKDKIKDKLHRH